MKETFNQTHKQYFIELSWKLIAYRLAYYYPEKVHPSWKDSITITDSKYDYLERLYKSLCKLLNEPDTVASMVELDFSRPCVELAVKKYSTRKLR